MRMLRCNSSSAAKLTTACMTAADALHSASYLLPVAQERQFVLQSTSAPRPTPLEECSMAACQEDLYLATRWQVWSQVLQQTLVAAWCPA
jgi:hypothetical protein